MIRAEKELWIHYHQQKANAATDRLFAAFAGTQLVGVARCSRYRTVLKWTVCTFLKSDPAPGFCPVGHETAD